MKRYKVLFDDGLNFNLKANTWYVWAKNMKEAKKLANLEAKARIIVCHVDTIEFTVRSIKLAANQ